MKKLILILTLSFFSNFCYSQFESSKQTYSAPGLKDSIKKHKTVAILPFRVTISYKRVPKNFDAEGNKQDELKEAINMQQGMYTYLLRKQSDFTVTFQDPQRTNILLKQDSVFDKLDQILPDSLCKILGVDAVIVASYDYQKTGSEGAAIAKAVLFGSGGKTANGALTMQVYDKSSGTLLWRFFKEMNESWTSNANELMERMMKKVARNFPYEK
jgi:hypothetical protein